MGILKLRPPSEILCGRSSLPWRIHRQTKERGVMRQSKFIREYRKNGLKYSERSDRSVLKLGGRPLAFQIPYCIDRPAASRYQKWAAFCAQQSGHDSEFANSRRR